MLDSTERKLLALLLVASGWLFVYFDKLNNPNELVRIYMARAMLEHGTYAIGERRDFIYEHVWRLGDFLMWDNRCTIHARTDFPKDERRLLRRCTVEGEPLQE